MKSSYEFLNLNSNLIFSLCVLFIVKKTLKKLYIFNSFFSILNDMDNLLFISSFHFSEKFHIKLFMGLSVEILILIGVDIINLISSLIFFEFSFFYFLYLGLLINN